MRLLACGVGLVVALGCSPPAPMMVVDAGTGGGGGGGGAAGGGDGGGSASGGGQGGGMGGSGGAGGGAAPIVCTPATLDHLQARFSLYGNGGALNGFIDPSSRRLFTWPTSLSSSLQSMVTIRLVDAGTMLPDGGPGAFVETLPVRGTAVTGAVTASTFDPATGRGYALVFARDPYRYEVQGLGISDGGVQLTRLSSMTPDANGYVMQELGVSGNQLGAIRGNAILPIALTATTATFGAEVAGNPFADSSIYDAPNHRYLSIGGYKFLGPGMFQWVPEVKTRGALDPNWTVVPMSGQGPAAVDSPMPAPRPYLAFDAANNRLLVTSSRPGMIGTVPVTLSTLFEANLTTSSWNFLGDLNRTPTSAKPFAADPAYPQVFDTTWPLAPISLVKGQELKPLPFVLAGDLPPLSTPTAAVRLPDARVLVTTGGQTMLFDPATKAWKAVRGLLLPQEAQNGHALALDAANQRVLLFGGQYGAVPTAKLWAISLTTFAVSELATTGPAPSARWQHAMTVTNGQLVVAGGTSNATTALGDVFALDLTTLAWRKLADVGPRVKPALMVRDGEVWVVGGGLLTGATGEATIQAVTVTTGAVRSIAVQGAWPPRQGIFWAWAASGDGLLALDSGDTVDYGVNQLWELRFDGTVATWRNTDPNAMDDALKDVVGVSGSGCSDALFVGPNVFGVRRAP